MVELDSLENCCAGNCTVGSNPTLSAILNVRPDGRECTRRCATRHPIFALRTKFFSVHTPSMYKDIISYQLADEVTEAHLLSVAARIAESWMTKQPGFIKWEIHKDNTGGYTDIVYWNSKEDAKEAENEMVNIPNANDWYECYKENSIESKNLEQVRRFE